jgi:hypothetical protein
MGLMTSADPAAAAPDNTDRRVQPLSIASSRFRLVADNRPFAAGLSSKSASFAMKIRPGGSNA